MDLSAFTSPNGTLIKANHHITFVPKPLPPELSFDKEMTYLIAESHAKLGQLSGIGQQLPNPHILISPYLRREAVLSSKIEGTQASLSDLFLYEIAGEEPDEALYKRVREVRNYVRALETSLGRIRRKGKRVDLKLICDTHRYLLGGIRGQERRPGAFRKLQNWIGVSNKIEDAVYVPPDPSLLNEGLQNLEQFVLHPPDYFPILIRCAVLHYQFEALHPFLDGNGRIGRLLITLLLCEGGALSQPLLYLSAFFEKHKAEYYDALLSVSQQSDWAKWLKFFLMGVAQQCDEATDNVQKLIALKNRYDKKLRLGRVPRNAMILTDQLFSNPYTTVRNASEYLHVTFPTAQRAIKFLISEGILQEATSRKRNRLFVARDIIEILH